VHEFDRVAEILKRYHSHRITLIGHSDNIGEPGVRQSISLQRAEMTKKYLVEEKSFTAELLECEGRGSRDPIADNATEEGRARNRRVDIVVHSK
jgi:OOP family OmpA-OmpF porin